MEMKQKQTFFYGAYSNLTSFFIARKVLKYFNIFYNWYFNFIAKWSTIFKMK